jgi:predicted AAA+ superfamily ATPase
LIDTVSFRFSKDRGRLLENIVLVELKRRSKDVYYFRNGSECDFLIREGYNVTSAIQVTTSLKENEEREFNGLVKAAKNNKLKNGLILTENQEDIKEIDGIKIEIRPIWKWLLMDH